MTLVSGFQMELDIAYFANVTGDSSVALRFKEASQTRQKAMNSIFWNAEKGQWLDYWLSKSNTSKVIHLCQSFRLICWMPICIRYLCVSFWCVGCVYMGSFKSKSEHFCLKLYSVVDQLVSFRFEIIFSRLWFLEVLC